MITEKLPLENENIDEEHTIPGNALIERISQALFAIDSATPSDDEIDYKTLYNGIFNGISLILENTHTYAAMSEALKQLQCKAEEFYISQP